MGVSKSAVDRVRSAVDIIDVVREHVPTLKRVGSRWRGLCPFHNERTPSFYVNPDLGLWHCFGACQEGGDVFKFLMKLENLSFPEALQQMAARVGIQIDWEKTHDHTTQETRDKERYLNLLEQAAAFYQTALQERLEADTARRFLSDRRIKPASMAKFRVGYVPRQSGFLDHALHKGVPIEDILKTGLAARSEKTGRYHDPLMGRVVFPIQDIYGRIIGFGGRTLDEGEGIPKYINSPETVLYSKSRHLFGLFHAKNTLRDQHQAVLVEGYMDVIGCHQAGLTGVVALLGTAFTKDQALLLKRFVQEVVLLFDPDEAGVRASSRSAEILLQSDLFVRIARLPAGKDPDELILEQGTGALQAVLQSAEDVMDFWLAQAAAQSGRFQGLHEKIRQAEGLLDLLREVPNEILRHEWLRKISSKLGLDESALKKELRKKTPGGTRPPVDKGSHASGPAIPGAEEELLQLLCSHPEIWPEVHFDADVFQDERCAVFFRKLQSQWSATQSLHVSDALNEMSEADRGWMSRLVMEEKQFENPQETLSQLMKRLLDWKARRRLGYLEKEVLAMVEGRVPRDEAKLAEYTQLTKILKGKPEISGPH
ncbi:MAG TPA: DNA primase [Elusimicrobiota bacterium]|nr:DNA primase [Elusimicrobiota bacterium]